MASVLFIQTEWFEHLGLLYLASFIRSRGHRPELRLLRKPAPLLDAVSRLQPAVVAFSATTGAHRQALALARALRPHYSGLILLGGPHPTYFPEVIQDPALDIICRGEGEIPLAELLDRLDRGEDFREVPGLWVKQEGKVFENPPADLIADLDSIPFPDRGLLEQADPFLAKSAMRRLLTMRGCPYRCAYCYNGTLKDLLHGHGPYLRQRSVDNVLAELRQIQGPRTINVVDDTFGVKRDWALEFLERYAREFGWPLIVNARVELLDEDLARALKAANCHCVQIGIESGDAKIREQVLGRKVSEDKILAAAELLHRHRLQFLTYNMIGLPGETLDQAFATLALNGRLRAQFPRVSIFQPYPRTALGDQARALGLVAPDYAADQVSESYFRRSVLKRPDIRRLENLHKLFWPAIHWPGLKPLLLAATRLPANPLFDLVFLTSIGLQYRAATNRPLAETIALGLKNLRAYFS
ncbi:MAG: hypothetical protein A2V67_17560 [Deltaproteobacteria bacterium RBG_13_61_14]|nr:MAG: hypothetical protein A2V67_17560 [Deltaproteobacteria bacterium RBG_13_61_14]